MKFLKKILGGILSVALCLNCTFLKADRLPEAGETQEQLRQAGYKAAYGLPPLEKGEGIGCFTLKGLPNRVLTIPREYISYQPNQPNGEVERLILLCYLPWMTPYYETLYKLKREVSRFEWELLHEYTRQALENRGIFLDSDPDVKEALERRDTLLGYPFQVVMYLFPQLPLIQFKNGICLQEKFFVFQGFIRGFDTKPVPPPNCVFSNKCSRYSCVQRMRITRCVQNGQYDKELQLVAYKKPYKSESNREGQGDCLYLLPDKNPCDPGEWIVCKGNCCTAVWFRDGIRIDALFERPLLARYAEVRYKLDRKLDEFLAVHSKQNEKGGAYDREQS